MVESSYAVGMMKGIKQGVEQGIEQGIKKGAEQGEKQKALKIAMNLIEKGVLNAQKGKCEQHADTTPQHTVGILNQKDAFKGFKAHALVDLLVFGELLVFVEYG